MAIGWLRAAFAVLSLTLVVSSPARAQWLKAETDPKHIEPPFWVSSWLALYLLPGAAARADQVAAYLMSEIDHAAS